MAGGTFGVTIRDRSDEMSSLNITIGEVTAGTLPGLLTATGALEDAIEDIILGNIATDRMEVYNNTVNNVRPTSPYANRETKFLVRYRDNQAAFGAVPNEGFGKVFTVSIATPNLALSGLLTPGSDFVNLAQTEIAAFVTAFEGVARSPYQGTVTVESIEIVGRNN